MKKNFQNNHSIYTLGASEREAIREAYYVFLKLIDRINASTDGFGIQEEKALRIRINNYGSLSLGDLEDFIYTMENMASANTISWDYEKKEDFE